VKNQMMKKYQQRRLSDRKRRQLEIRKKQLLWQGEQLQRFPGFRLVRAK